MARAQLLHPEPRPSSEAHSEAADDVVPESDVRAGAGTAAKIWDQQDVGENGDGGERQARLAAQDSEKVGASL